MLFALDDVTSVNQRYLCSVNGVGKNNNLANEASAVDIPGEKYNCNNVIMEINSLLKRITTLSK